MDPLAVDVRELLRPGQRCRREDNFTDAVLAARARKELTTQRQERREDERRRAAERFAAENSAAVGLTFDAPLLPALRPEAPADPPPSAARPSIGVGGAKVMCESGVGSSVALHSPQQPAARGAPHAWSPTSPGAAMGGGERATPSPRAVALRTPSTVRRLHAATKLALLQREEAYARAGVMEQEAWRWGVCVKVMNCEHLAGVLAPLQQQLHEEQAAVRVGIHSAEAAARRQKLVPAYRQLTNAAQLLRPRYPEQVVDANGDESDGGVLPQNARFVLAACDCSLGATRRLREEGDEGEGGEEEEQEQFLVIIDVSPILVDEHMGRSVLRAEEHAAREQLAADAATGLAVAEGRQRRREHLHRCSAWRWKHARSQRQEEIYAENQAELASVESAALQGRRSVEELWYEQLVHVVWGAHVVQHFALLKLEARMRQFHHAEWAAGARGAVVASEALHRRCLVADWVLVVRHGMRTLHQTLAQRARCERAQLLALRLDDLEEEEEAARECAEREWFLECPSKVLDVTGHLHLLDGD